MYSPLWKRVIAWERSRTASGYGIIWGYADRNKQEEFMHQSIPVVPIPSWATAGHLPTLSVPGEGHKHTPGRPPGIWHTCFRKMDDFIGKDETFVKDRLVRQGLEKPVDVFKVPMKWKIICAYLKGLSKYRRMMFFFLKYPFSFRDIDAVLLWKLDQWWRHIVCN